jgi:hypothetical protein
MGPKALHLVDPAASDALYTACFLVNTVFMCLTCAVLYFVAERICGRQGQWIKDLSLLLMMFLMAITQYVVVPYDLISYFFLAVSMLAMVRDPISAGWTALLCSAVVLGALTRETVVLILAFYVAVYAQRLIERPKGWRLNRVQMTLALALACFAVTSAILRAYYGTDNAYQQFAIPSFFRFAPNIVGTLFLVALVALMLLSEPGRSNSTIFLLAASPYTIAIFLFASPWETRLFCPIFLCLIVLKLRAVGPPVSVNPAL